jgi:hypothetical protein
MIQVYFYYQSSKPIIYLSHSVMLSVLPLVGDIIRLIPDQVSKNLKDRHYVKACGVYFRVTERKIFPHYESYQPNRSVKYTEYETWTLKVEPVKPFEDIKP